MRKKARFSAGLLLVALSPALSLSGFQGGFDAVKTARQ
jgi:hypothetical protein